MTTLTIPTAAVQICWDAATIIEARGFDRNCEICQESGHVDLIGALRLAARPDYPRWATVWTPTPNYEDALRLLNHVLGDSPRSWSREFGRTQAEVVALLRGVGA